MAPRTGTNDQRMSALPASATHPALLTTRTETCIASPVLMPARVGTASAGTIAEHAPEIPATGLQVAYVTYDWPSTEPVISKRTAPEFGPMIWNSAGIVY